MPSIDAPGSVPVVDRQNASFRNEGGSLTIVSGLPSQTGPTSAKVATILLPQGHDRSAAEFGTQPDRVTTQYSTLCINPTKKVATSDEVRLNDGVISRESGKVAPDAGNQPEIALKPVSQRSTYNTGGRIVIRNSDDDSLVARHRSAL